MEAAYGITSVPPNAPVPNVCSPGTAATGLLENGNHYRRDATMGEDASRIRARHAPANNAT